MTSNYSANSLKVVIHKEGNIYVATLFGGWYVARGKTVQEAIKRVTDKYYKEKDYFLRV